MTTQRMDSKPRYLPQVVPNVLLVVALAITLVTGAVYGRYTQRWGPVPDLVAKGISLRTMPKEIGDWLLVNEGTLGAIVQETLACTGYVNRTYVNRQTGQEIGMAVYVGPAGPISVHTPEICYSSTAYEIRGSRRSKTVSGPNDEENTFWQLTFRSTGAEPQSQRVYYGWSLGDRWNASESPRFEYGGQPALYKLQIATRIPQADEQKPDDACKDFLLALVRSGWKLHGSTVN